MTKKIKERCIYCGGDIYYSIGQPLVKCEWCGQTLITARFENELIRIKETEKESALIKQRLEKAEEEKQAAEDRLFAALSGLGSLEGAQGETLDLLNMLRTEATGSADALGRTLQVLVSGQQDADQKLILLKQLSEKLLLSQNDFLQMSLTQADIVRKLYELEMDVGQRDKVVQDFIGWMQNIKAEDTEKLSRISKASGSLLEEQKKISDNVEQLQKESSRLQQSLEVFADKWESSRLQELRQLYHQAESFQHDKKFDKAEEYYRKVLVKGGDDAEVYWRLVMCHYCLFYQKDDAGRFIPIILNPDLTDPNEMYLRRDLLRNLSGEEREHYLGELSRIDRILNNYRLLKDKMKFDVFISVKQSKDGRYTSDSDVASDLYDFLTSHGLRVFNSRRSVIPAGQEYEPYIISALMSARVMLVVGTTPDNMNAQWVRNEWTRFHWLQRREMEQTGRTERVLICYLAKGMQAKQIPKALNQDKQAIIDGVKAHDELLESIAFLRKAAFASNEAGKESGEKEYYRVLNQMTLWLIQGKYHKVSERYDELAEKGLFLTRAKLHLAALCARFEVPDIEKIVQSKCSLEQETEYQAARTLCQDDNDREYLDKLRERNRKWHQEENGPAPKTKPVPEPEPEPVPTPRPIPDSALECFRLGQEAEKRNHCRAAARYYQISAEKGCLQGMERYAFCLQHGLGIDPNEEKAAEWYRKAITLWLREAASRKSAGQTKKEDAVQCYREAAQKGNASAQYELGVCYFLGQGVARNEHEAEAWFQKAAAQNHAGAVNWLKEIDKKKSRKTEEEWLRMGKEAAGRKHDKVAFRYFWEAARAGSPEAQYNVGISYFLGRGVTADKNEAIRWLRKAADQGHAGASNWLKEVKVQGGVQQKKKQLEDWYQQAMKQLQQGKAKEAVPILQKAAEGGHMLAQNELGNCYRIGKGVQSNIYSARKWYQKAGEQGYVYAQYNLGYLLKSSESETNRKNARTWLRKAANQNYAEAQNELGLCYDRGIGGSKNYSIAVKWFKQAAENGHAAAQYSYAYYLQEGLGVPKNEAEAVKWYRKSAEGGLPDGQNRLGLCYDTGRGVVMNKAEAVKWFKMAAKNGNTAGQHNYALYLQGGIGIQKNEAEAVKWFRKSAEGGFPFGQYNYAICLDTGKGITKNEAEAVSWYRKAANAGLAIAQYKLGECYEKGRGIAVNKEEAKVWYQKAAYQGNEQAEQRLKKLNKKGWFF